MKQVDYKQIFSIQKDIERRLKLYCPSIDHKSGIYFLIRQDETGKFAYIGKSVDVLNRMVSHVQGNQQRIDGSLKKRGFCTADNKLGWKLGILYFPEEQLDEKERFYIDKYKNAGYELYNVEDGGTIGKMIIGDRKPPKGYLDGLRQGYLNARKEVAHWFDLHLDYSIKGKPTINKQKAFEKFKDFINYKGEKDGGIQ